MTSERPASVTIVGASLAGLRGAEALRRAGYDGAITLLGAEPHLPYDRPPLSKKILSGVWELEKSQLATAERLGELSIDVELGVTATGLDLAGQTLSTSAGDRPFDALMIATGARCRNLPGADDLAGVHVLRGLDDCAALRSELAAAAGRVVVIGAGFIGAEVAATARTMELDVTMLEAAPHPLQRVLHPDLGQLMADIHVEHGVDVRCGVGVAELGAEGGRVTNVQLDDGTVIDAEIVVVGIGVIPNTEWLEGSGLTIDNGVVCDATTLAAPGVTAAGDVARWASPRYGGELLRVEQWDNAVSMGMHAAVRLITPDDEATAYDPVPWFWSDQFDRKIQLAGRSYPDVDLHIVEGTVEERRFVALLEREGAYVGVFGMNRPRHVMQYKGLLDQGASLADALAAGF